MKLRGFCLLLALTLAVMPALAEEEPTVAPVTDVPVATSSPTPEPSPTPSPTPEPVAYEGDGLRFVLPVGFELLKGDALAGFEAALRADYPDAAETILAATDASREAAILVAAIDSDADCLDAARDAADALLGDADSASEVEFGENRCASFACAIGERPYYLYFLSDGARLLVFGLTGLEDAEEVALLASVDVGWEESPAETMPMETAPAETLPAEDAQEVEGEASPEP